MVFLVAGCGKDTATPDRDLTAGPILRSSTSTPAVPWCEDLEADGLVFDEVRGDCQYKYLERGMKYWQKLASVAFVGNVVPDCHDGVLKHCIPSEFGEDCLVICPFAVKSISHVLFGDPGSIAMLSSFTPQVSNLVDDWLYHFDGSYPSDSWTVSGGRNLVFANRACFAEKYTGERDVYLITGLYPVVDDTIFDLDDVTTSVSSLQTRLASTGFTVEEEESYSRRCHFDSFTTSSGGVAENAVKTSEPIRVLPPPAP